MAAPVSGVSHGHLGTSEVGSDLEQKGLEGAPQNLLRFLSKWEDHRRFLFSYFCPVKHFSLSVKILTFLLRDKKEFNDYGKILSGKWEVIHDKTREVFVSFAQ